MLEYAPKGLIGLLTPQANTTVEAEMAILCPNGHATIAARLTSARPTIDERLADYILSVDTTLDRFANAPLAAVAFACTGASYLVDPAREADAIAAIEAARGYKFITAAGAVLDALKVLGAARVGIVSPYDGSLHDRCLEYWSGRGVDIGSVARIESADAAFHPIYALRAASADAATAALADDVTAIAILGTGLATLPVMRRLGGRPVPVISPNLCLMWRASIAARNEAPAADNLAPWISGAEWGTRFDMRVGD